MTEELISEIFKSRESASYYFFSESRKVQDTYWQKFLKQSDTLLEHKVQEVAQEYKYFMKVKETVESKIFQHLLENDRYREKVDLIFSTDKLVIGKSDTKLLKIYQDLLILCDSYRKEYEKFLEKAEKGMRKELNKFDTDSKIVFELVFNTNVCRESFFNSLNNHGLI